MKKKEPYIFLLFIILSILFISPDKKAMITEYHSEQLTKRVTIVDECTERIDYIDQNHRITIAADLEYATLISKKTNNTKLDKYYDEKGNPVRRYQGYYAILWERDENGKNTRITYLDSEDNPVMILSGYSIEERKYNTTGGITEVRYYDNNYMPVETKAFGYGKNNLYDEKGNLSQTVYIDSSGNPMMTSQGYAIAIYKYSVMNEKNNCKAESEFYLDETGNPVALFMGQYGVHKEYNDLGQDVLLTYLDAKGNPIVTTKGYTTVIRSFGADNNVESERYFDLEGNPFSLSGGSYGYKIVDSNVIYLNQRGEKTTNLKYFLYKHSWIAIVCAMIAVALSAYLDKKCNVFLLVISVCIIIYFTLLYRESGKRLLRIGIFRLYRYILFDSESRSDILKNIWLFIPLGTVLFRLFHNKYILLIPIIISIAVEVIQYFTTIGICDIDDVISNSIGGWIGYIVGEWLTTLKSSSMRSNHSNCTAF